MVTILGVVLTFVEKWFAPTAMILEPGSTSVWVGWLAFIAASFGAIGYILIDA